MKEKDTDPTSNDNEGLIKELDDDMEKAAYAILDLSVVPVTSPYDTCASMEHDANITSEGDPTHMHSVVWYSNVPPHWKFNEEVAPLITSKRKKDDVVMSSKMQMLGKKELSVIVPVLAQYFISKQEQLKRRNSTHNSLQKSTVYFYELHDRKMLCMMTKHALWNHKHYPFSLHGCKHGQGVNNV
eukprot:6045246-Ditylum_brightwellii.AAC.1